MSDNIQSLSEKQGIEKGTFSMVKNLDKTQWEKFSKDSHIPEIQLHGAQSFYQIDKNKISKKNFFGKCEFETDAGSINFYSHVQYSVYNLEISNLNEFYNSISSDPSKIQKELNDSGLTGRGGAGFPFAKKLEFCAQQKNDTKYVVCNAEEGDTGAFSDKYLLESQPHLVLAGMYSSALVIGAQEGILYISDEYLKAIEIVKAEVINFEKTEAYKKRPFKFHVVKGDNAYITGEESALLNSLEGLRAEVRTRPPFPGEEGLFKKPTLLSNVETFASIPWIITQGGAKHGTLGTAQSKGVKLVSLGALFNTPGVHEVEFGVPLEKVIKEYGGGFSTKAKALQVGGPLGGVLPIDQVSKLNLSIESFRDAGFLLGHASIVVIPEGHEMIRFLRDLLEFTANESCGKCFPCRLGSKAGEQMLTSSLDKSNKVDREAFNNLIETLEKGSLCGLGGGVPIPIKNVLQHFSKELEVYFSGGLS